MKAICLFVLVMSMATFAFAEPEKTTNPLAPADPPAPKPATAKAASLGSATQAKKKKVKRTKASVTGPKAAPAPTPDATPFPELMPLPEPSPSPTPVPTPLPEPTPEAATMVNPVPTPPAALTPATADATPRHWRFGGGLYYSFGSSLAFNNAQFNGTSFKADYKLARAFGLQVEANNVDVHAWGAQIGLMLDGQRNITSVDNSGGIVSHVDYGNSGSQPTIDLRTAYINAVYKWTNFYLPFGLNLSGGTLTNPPELLTAVSGGIGAQAGFGWDINDHVAAEALLRTMTLRGKPSTNASGVTSEAGLGIFSGWQIGIKAYF